MFFLSASTIANLFHKLEYFITWHNITCYMKTYIHIYNIYTLLTKAEHFPPKIHTHKLFINGIENQKFMCALGIFNFPLRKCHAKRRESPAISLHMHKKQTIYCFNIHWTWIRQHTQTFSSKYDRKWWFI